MNFGHHTLDSRQLIDRRYRFIRSIGEGATGGVILVEDTALGDRLLAVKILLPHLLNNETSISRFRSETRITMSLSHPNIVQTFGMGSHENSFYYLKMEYCEGQSLRSLIEAHPHGVPTEQAISILHDVAAALEYAHSRGVIHRDLKPENIIITAGPLARLLDFGLAQSFESDTRVTSVGSVLGTPNYMAPEQLRSELLDSRCDIYSFGIVAYELLTGSRPFRGDSLFALAEAHLHEALPPLDNSGGPDWLISIIERCCQKNRLKRPDSMSGICQQLEKHTAPQAPLSPQSEGPHKPANSISDTRSQLRYRTMRRIMSQFRILALAILPAMAIVAPHVNESARWRYLVATAVIEKHVGHELPLLRLISNAPPDLNFPASAFGPSNARLKELKEHGYRLTEELDDRKYFRPYIRAGYSPNFLDPVRGTYPVHFYTRMFKGRAAGEFLEYGADPNLFDRFGNTALDYATSRTWGVVETLSILLQHGADPAVHNKGENPPLVKLLKGSHLAGVRLILKSPLNDPDIKDRDGNPAIFTAIASDSVVIVELMIEHGADVTLRDKDGRDVLESIDSLPQSPRRDEIKIILRDALEEAKGPKSIRHS